ncbi:MAG: hypothetical protein ACWIPJ_10635, partial [Polaribacter sp.]
MKRYNLLILLLTINFNLLSQNLIPVKIILKDKDTLEGEMKVKINSFIKDFIYSSSFNNIDLGT